MNRRVIFLSALAAVLMMSLVAYGQDRPRQGGPGGRMGMMGSAMLLRAEAVQKELGITDGTIDETQGSTGGPARPAGATERIPRT